MPTKPYTVNGRRAALLCEGHLDPHNAKTAMGLLIWQPEDVVAVIDSTHAGGDLEALVGFGRGIPIVSTVAEAADRGANQLVIGVANIGGVLVPGYRAYLAEGLERGMSIVNGLHELLADDAELAPIAKRTGAAIYDLRVAGDVPVGSNQARRLDNRRVLTVGTDCNVGKMCTTLSLQRELERLGLDVAFAPTGQTGILIAGAGLCIDRAICDFASGVAEKLVLDRAAHEWVLVEGQGSIDHPGYSGVTLSLLHGSAPQALVLCHAYERTGRRHDDGSPLQPIGEVIRLYETIAAPIQPARIVGISVMTRGLDDDGARRYLEGLEREHGMPAVDPLRFGAGPLADALIGFFEHCDD